MGGSSLCPDVLKATFGKIAGFPELHVPDSTDPAQVGLTCTWSALFSGFGRITLELYR